MTLRRSLLALVLAALLVPGCDEAAPVAVGVSTSAMYVDAARLALIHAREDGMTTPVDTVIIPEVGNLAAPALSAAETFVATPGMVAVLGHSNSGSSMAASHIYNQRGVVQIAPTASAAVYSRAGPYSFRMVPPDDRQGGYIARAVAERLPEGGRVALIYVNDEYGRGLRAALLPALQAREVPVQLDLPYLEPDTTAEDIAFIAETLRQTAPDILVWLGRGSTLRLTIGAIRAAVGPVPIIGGDAVSSVHLFVPLDAEWDGVSYVDFCGVATTPEARRFREDYQTRFHQHPSVHAALSYDAMRILLDGIAAGARSGDAMREYLSSLGRSRPAHAGASGPVVFDEHGGVNRSYRLVPARAEAP